MSVHHPNVPPLFSVMAWFIGFAVLILSIINAVLIFWYKVQYLGQCNNNQRVAGYFGVNGDTEQEILASCQRYFQNVAIASIIVTIILNIMNVRLDDVVLTLAKSYTNRDSKDRFYLETHSIPVPSSWS